MSRQFEQDLNSTIIFVLNTADVDRLRDLFARFGLKPDEISLYSARSLMAEYGVDFWNEFSTLGREVLNDRDKMAEIRRHYNGISRGDGGSKVENADDGEPKTQEQKDRDFEKGIGIFRYVVDSGLEYFNKAIEYKSIEEKYNAEADENLVDAVEQEGKSVKTGLIIVGVIMVIAVVALVLLKVFKK